MRACENCLQAAVIYFRKKQKEVFEDDKSI